MGTVTVFPPSFFLALLSGPAAFAGTQYSPQQQLQALDKGSVAPRPAGKN